MNENKVLKNDNSKISENQMNKKDLTKKIQELGQALRDSRKALCLSKIRIRRGDMATMKEYRKTKKQVPSIIKNIEDLKRLCQENY